MEGVLSLWLSRNKPELFCGSKDPVSSYTLTLQKVGVLIIKIKHIKNKRNSKVQLNVLWDSKK